VRLSGSSCAWSDDLCAGQGAQCAWQTTKTLGPGELCARPGVCRSFLRLVRAPESLCGRAGRWCAPQTTCAAGRELGAAGRRLVRASEQKVRAEDRWCAFWHGFWMRQGITGTRLPRRDRRDPPELPRSKSEVLDQFAARSLKTEERAWKWPRGFPAPVAALKVDPAKVVSLVRIRMRLDLVHLGLLKGKCRTSGRAHPKTGFAAS